MGTLWINALTPMRKKSYCITGKFLALGNFATGKFREFGDRGGLQLGRWERGANIRVQENFANLAIFAKFAKISCTRILRVIQ